MAELFIDETGNWSDPILMEHRFLNSKLKWVYPKEDELFLCQDGTWKEINLYPPFKYSMIVSNGDDPSPAAVEYDDDNKDYIPAIGSSLNSWQSFIRRYLRPCVIKPDKTTPEYYLQYDNFTLKEDGTPANLDGSDGDVMIQVRKMYGHFIPISDTSFEVSFVNNRIHDEDVCYTKFGGIEYGYAYRGVYEGSLDPVLKPNTLRSISNSKIWVGQYPEVYRDAANARGKGYWQDGFKLTSLYQGLYLLCYKNKDAQTVLGEGYTNAAHTETLPTGTCDTKPFCWGGTDDEPVKLFGCENFWGNGREWVDGIIRKQNVYYATRDPEKFNNDGSGYELSYTIEEEDYKHIGYMKTVIGNNDFMFAPLDCSGDSSHTYFCDYGGGLKDDYTYNLDFGGSYGSGHNAGPFTMYFGQKDDMGDNRYCGRLCRI